MAKVKSNQPTSRKMRPALSPEADERQLISMAADLARQQLADGTASSQVITHFLKLGSTRERLERERLEEENKLLKAKTEQLQSQKRMEELYTKAISAMKNYAGYGDEEEYDDEEY